MEKILSFCQFMSAASFEARPSPSEAYRFFKQKLYQEGEEREKALATTDTGIKMRQVDSSQRNLQRYYSPSNIVPKLKRTQLSEVGS